MIDGYTEHGMTRRTVARDNDMRLPGRKARRLVTVQERRNRGQASAEVTLSGKWLEAAGFLPGTPCDVLVADGHIVLKASQGES